MAELTIRDHEPVVIDGPVRAGKTTFSTGDTVSLVDRFGRRITGVIRRFERLDTKTSATGQVTRRATPAYYASVHYEDRLSILFPVGKLAKIASGECFYVPAYGDPAAGICLTHNPDLRLRGGDTCARVAVRS